MIHDLSPLREQVENMKDMSWNDCLLFFLKLDVIYSRASEILAEKLRPIFPNRVVFDNNYTQLFQLILGSMSAKEIVIWRISEKLRGKHSSNFTDADKAKISDVRRQAQNIRVRINSKIAKVASHLFGDVEKLDLDGVKLLKDLNPI